MRSKMPREAARVNAMLAMALLFPPAGYFQTLPFRLVRRS
jgi:hypothetical protein